MNLLAPILLTRTALPALREGDAAIVNVLSGFGLVGMPFYSVYAVTKAACRNARRTKGDTECR